MNKFTALLRTFMILLLLLAFACKKKSGPANIDLPETPEKPVIPTKPDTQVKQLVPLSISTDNQKIDFQYAATGDFLTELRQSNGTREMILYNDKNQLKQYKRFMKDDLLYQVYYVLDNTGLVTKGIQYKVEAAGKLISPLGYYQPSYNEKQQIESVDWYDFKDMLIKTQTFSYDKQSLFIGKKTSGNPPTNLNFSYDEHAGIFKQVPLIQILSLEHEAFYMLNNKSNVKSIINESEPDADQKFEMQYNANGYPTTITQTNVSGKSKVYKVTYR